MEKSKLIELLKTFNSKELREFGDFVASPFYNKKKELIPFYGYLRQLAPTFPTNKINRQYAYNQVFPQQAYDEKHQGYLMSFLLKLAEQFVGVKHYQSLEYLSNCHILEGCRIRRIDKHYIYLNKKTLQALGATPYRNADYYYQQYYIADIGNRHFEQQNIRKFDQHLQLAADYFDQFYIAKKLKYICEALDRKKFLPTGYAIALEREIVDYLSENDHSQNPAIAIYYKLYLTLTSDNSGGHFNELKSLLIQFFDFFPEREMKQLYFYAINFCIYQIRLGNSQYLQELLNLYNKGIETRLLFEKEHLSPWTYKNVVKLGLNLTRYDWTEQFIQNNIDKLQHTYREDALHFSMADLHYHKKDFNKAMNHLSLVEFSDIYYNIDAKVMLIKIYYQTNALEALLALLSAFKIFLQRNKLIPNNVREPYLNFTKIVYQFTRSKPDNLSVLKEKIAETKLLIDRNWLLQQHQLLKEQ